MVIELDRVTKRFGPTVALDDVSLEVREEETLGLVGPNGAGKTTAIRILLGLIRPDRGSARIYSSGSPFPRIFRSLGYAGGESEHYAAVSADRLFRLAADVRGDASFETARVLALRLDLDTRTPIRKLSRGNRQKVSIVLCFMGRPRIIILDEPTTSLDPVSQQAVLELVREAGQGGATVLVSSHQLHDIEKACDRICLIHGGRVRETVTIQEIKRRSRSTVTVTLRANLPKGVPALPGVEVRPLGSRTWEIVTQDVPAALEQLVPAGIVDIEIRKASLEQYFQSTLALASEARR